MRRKTAKSPFELREPTPKPRHKGIHIGAPACFALEDACQQLYRAFCANTDEYGGGIYVVGSVLERPNWRDVDVRLILPDCEFEKLFPDAGQHWEFDPRWLWLTISISERLSRLTGLPVDFQFQPQTQANKVHKGRRYSCGMIFAPERRAAKDTSK